MLASLLKRSLVLLMASLVKTDSQLAVASMPASSVGSYEVPSRSLTKLQKF